MTDAEEERSEPRRPRVVDKRVSARTSAAPPPETTPGGTGSHVPAPAETGPAEPATAPDPVGTSSAPGSAQPSGASPPRTGAPGPEAGVWTPEREAEAQAIAEELARVPALDWVANAAVTLANVAAAKIQMGQAPDAQIAIDALTALIDGMGSSFGEAEQPLRQTLTQLKLAYAQAVMPPGTGSPG